MSEVYIQWRTPLESRLIEVIALSQKLRGVGEHEETVLEIELSGLRQDTEPELATVTFYDVVLYQVVDESFYPPYADNDPYVDHEVQISPLTEVADSELLLNFKAAYPYVGEYYGDIRHFRINGASQVVDVLTPQPGVFNASQVRGHNDEVPNENRFITQSKLGTAGTGLRLLSFGLKASEKCIVRPLLYLLSAFEQRGIRHLYQLSQLLISCRLRRVGSDVHPPELKTYVDSRINTLLDNECRLIGTFQLCDHSGRVQVDTVVWTSADSRSLVEFSLRRPTGFPSSLFRATALTTVIQSQLPYGAILLTTDQMVLNELASDGFQVQLVDRKLHLSERLAVHKARLEELPPELYCELIEVENEESYEAQHTSLALQLSYVVLARLAELEKKSLAKTIFSGRRFFHAKHSLFVVENFSKFFDEGLAYTTLDIEEPSGVANVCEFFLNSGRPAAVISTALFIKEGLRHPARGWDFQTALATPRRAALFRRILLNCEYKVFGPTLLAYVEVFGMNASGLEEVLASILLRDPLSIPRCLDAIAAVQGDSLDLVRDCLGSSDYLVRWAALSALSSSAAMSSEGRQHLKEALRDANHYVRAEASLMLREDAVINGDTLGADVLRFNDVEIWFSNWLHAEGKSGYSREELEEFLEKSAPKILLNRQEYHNQRGTDSHT